MEFIAKLLMVLWIVQDSDSGILQLGMLIIYILSIVSH
jgi:hypothetical protein